MSSPFIDDDEADERSEEAWQIARDIVASLPPPSWPPLPMAFDAVPAEYRAIIDGPARVSLNEAYFYGLAYSALTVRLSLDANGIRAGWPLLAEVSDEPPRLVSYETTLADLDARTLRIMSGRFTALAALCDKLARG